jgi:hypothetical protein
VPLEHVPLAVPAAPSPYQAVLGARGPCGEFVVLVAQGRDIWLGSFAP